MVGRTTALRGPALRWGLLSTALCGFGFVPACYEVKPIALGQGLRLEVDEQGAVALEEFDIQGHFYAYGDNYGEHKSCTDIGKHDEESCSLIGFPYAKVPELGFPNSGGKMCLSGVAAQVLGCCKGESSSSGGEGGAIGESQSDVLCRGENTVNCYESLDHSNIWGAGMGFDLNFQVPEDGRRDLEALSSSSDLRKPWNASDHKVLGISFVLEWHGAQAGDEDEDEDIPIRVEFPMKIEEGVDLPTNRRVQLKPEQDPLERLPDGFSTEQHPYGSPYARYSGDWGSSKLKQGRNTILWEDVQAPPEDEMNYLEDDAFDGDSLLGVQFHVYTNENEPTPFSFCVSDLTFLYE